MTDPRPIMRRLSAAREAPGVTCSASRHAQQIAERLMLQVDMPDDRTPHAGESIGATVAALWEARATIARLEDEAKLHQSAIDSLSSRCEYLTMTQQLFIAERDAAQEHAALYWWLRNDASDWDAAGIIRLLAGPDYERLSGAELDAAIRAAMKGEP